MTANGLPPEVIEAIEEAERSVYRYRAIITRSPYEGQFKQALDANAEWKQAITTACEEAYAAGQAMGRDETLQRFTDEERLAALRREAAEVREWVRNDPELAERARRFYAEREQTK